MAEEHYVLGSGEAEEQRLILQHSLYEKSSRQLLLDAGLRPGLSVLELGCGLGLMTEWLCQQIGKEGALIAIDVNQRFLNSARDKISDYDHGEVMLKDVHHINDWDKQFDLIYGRMLFHHLTDPEKALRQVVSCLKPGGMIVLEESPCMEHVFAYPELPALKFFKELTIKTYIMNRSDYQIAYTMFDLLRQAGLQIEVQQIFQPLLGLEQRKLHLTGLRNLSARMVELELIDQATLEQLMLDLEKELSQAQIVSLYKLLQVVAVKHSA